MIPNAEQIAIVIFIILKACHYRYFFCLHRKTFLLIRNYNSISSTKQSFEIGISLVLLNHENQYIDLLSSYIRR